MTRTLFDPARHEPVTETPWDERVVHEAIVRITNDAEAAFREESFWEPHPRDEVDFGIHRLKNLYLGASGVIWAFRHLASLGIVELRRDWRSLAAALPERYLEEPDESALPIPSLLDGEAGVLLVAHMAAPSKGQEDRLLEVVDGNAENPAWELMYGSAGTMLAAQFVYERTGDERFADVWRRSADRLWAEWRDELWLQDLEGKKAHLFGAAHGLVGNVAALARGDLLEPKRRSELERRAAATLSEYALRWDGLAQWPISLEDHERKAVPTRTQWCHGAAGIVASIASLAPTDDVLTEVLCAGGELVWRAGPIADTAGLCHGTAGNGYAFLSLFARTGDERWLLRARSFAMHAIEQVERARVSYGRGRFTLWTGDLGTAVFLQSCLNATPGLPTIDVF